MLQLIRGCTSSLLVSSAAAAAAAARSMSVSSILSVSTESHLVLTIPQPLFSRSTTILLLIVPWIYFQHQVLCELPMFSLLHTMLCIWHLKHQSFFLFFFSKASSSSLSRTSLSPRSLPSNHCVPDDPVSAAAMGVKGEEGRGGNRDGDEVEGVTSRDLLYVFVHCSSTTGLT